MTPSWYDVLDVDPSASVEEIRAAWKAAIVDLEPTDRRFRLLNQAAEALLDPAGRARHDVALAADADAAAEPDSATATSATATSATAPSVITDTRKSARKPRDPSRTRRGPSWTPPVWVLAGVFVLVGVMVGLCAWQSTIPTDSSVESSTRAAQSTAERAAVAVLSYDYRDLDANQDAAAAYLTANFRKDYDALFAQIKANADVKPVVSAEIVASGITRVNRDGNRVSVLVFVNRPTTNAAKTTPEIYQDQVTMDMEKVNGEWLVDDMITTTAAQ